MSVVRLSDKDAEKMGLKRGHKYRAKPTVVDGIRFASKKEAKRYSELKIMEKAKIISMICTQPKFSINVNGQFICNYIADFSYNLHDSYGNSGRVIEDVKSAHTRKLPLYRLKKKLVEAQYGIEIQEV